MAIKRKHCMIEEKEYSLWHLLPHDVLWMIIERLDLIACHCVSAVCGNWSSVCKSYRTLKSFPMPKDTFPWLMMRKNKFSGMEIQLYRPSTNKTYKMDFPEIYGTHCLYSKDGWLLLHELEQRKSYESVKLCLINLFTRDKMELPEMKANKQIFRTKGTFSTHSNCPDCVIIIKGEFHHRLVTLYAWKKGSYTWKKTQVYDNMFADNMNNIWVRDDQLYIFTDRKCFTFDRDLNFKVQNMFQNILNLKNMIFFRKNDEISFMVREECTKVRSLLLNNMKNSSCCQIKPSTKELYHKVVFENESFALFLGTVYQYDRSTRKWVEFNFNNLISSSEEDIGILEREQQIKAKKQLLIEKLQHGGKISTEDGTFVVCGPKSGISNWIHVG